MALQKQVNPYQRATIATPPNWEEVQEEERQFVNAEEARLRYVAATRAGLRLVISQREKPSARNPWKPLAPYLEGEVEMEVEDCDYAPEVTDTISPEQHQAALGEIDQQWETVSQPTYDVVGAKVRAVTGGEHFEGTRHGEQWGTVIHTLLERRMADPEEDIEALAYSAVRGEDLSDARAQEALTVVENVVDSEIWKRGRAAERCIPEAPFRRLIEDGERPVISRGVIDLAFKEDGAWVIVDYKTDNTEENEVGELVEHYKPQLDAYAAAWEECTGDRVKEAGLYFTRGAQYVECR
jgi:ATP-dependent helicase/nuclease subunit A